MKETFPSWDWTPREIALWQENQRLERDVVRLKNLVNIRPDTPLDEEREMISPSASRVIDLPVIGGIEAARVESGMLAVKVWAGAISRQDSKLAYQYHIAGETMLQSHFINQILPEMHMRVLREFSKIYIKES
jgi:hypothetical protein